MYPTLPYPDTLGKVGLNPIDDFIINGYNTERKEIPITDLKDYCRRLHGWLEFMRTTRAAIPYGTAVFLRVTRHLHAWAYDAMLPHRNQIDGFDAYEQLLFSTYNAYADLSVDTKNADECLLAERQAILIAVEAVKRCRANIGDTEYQISADILDFAEDLLSSIRYKTEEQQKALRDARIMRGRSLDVTERTVIMEKASVMLANCNFEHKGEFMTAYWDDLCSTYVKDLDEGPESELYHYCDCVRNSIHLEAPDEELPEEIWMASGAEFYTELLSECRSLNEDEEVCLGALANFNWKYATQSIDKLGKRPRSFLIGRMLDNFQDMVTIIRKNSHYVCLRGE